MRLLFFRLYNWWKNNKVEVKTPDSKIINKKLNEGYNVRESDKSTKGANTKIYVEVYKQN